MGELPVVGSVLRGGKLGKPSSLKDLAMAVLKIVSYMFLGVLLYTFPEINVRDPDAGPDWDWDVVDCMYFTMVTITTVGYGDMPLLSQEMRAVTAVFGLFGVVVIAGSLQVIADWFVERARKRFLQKQRSVLKEAQRAGELVRHEVLPAAPAPAPEPAPPPGPVGDKAPRPMRKLAPAEAPEAAELAVMSLSKDPSPVGLASPVGVSPVGAKEERAAPLPSPPTSPPPSPPPVAPAKSHQVFPVGKGSEGSEGPLAAAPEPPLDDDDKAAELVREARRASIAGPPKDEPPAGETGCFAGKPRLKYAYDMFMAFLPCLLFIVACFVMAVVENVQYDCYDTNLFPDHASIVASSYCWTLPIDAFYYAIITLSTIGYGDVTPTSMWGKLMAVFMIPWAIISLTNFMGKMHDLKTSKKMGLDKTLRERLMELEEVVQADNDGIVSPEEYVIFNLIKMQKVDDDTVNLLRDQFKALDADGSGELDAQDLALLQKACDLMQVDSVPTPRPAT